MKGKAFIPLILGLCVGLVAVKFLVDKIQNAKGSQGDQQTMTIVRATEDIGSYKALRAEMLEVITVPDSAIVPPRDRIESIEDVVGRVTSKSIPQFSPLLKSMLAEEGTLAGMVGRIPPGYRAVSVKIDEVSGVAYQIKPGDWVDVIVVMDIETGSASFRRETIAEVILQHVQVLAMGQGIRQKEGTTIKPAKSATLLVAEENAPKLHLAATRGKVTLSMRGADDDINEETQVARGRDVFKSMHQGDKAPSVPGMDASMLEQLMAMANSGKNQPPEVAEQPLIEPHTVTVHRGFTTANGLTSSASTAQQDWQQVQHTTFQNSHSRRILAISEGPANSTQALMAGEQSPTPGSMRDLMKSNSKKQGE